MIKKLRLKFVLVFFVLVVSVFITSSCYASETVNFKDLFNISVDEVAGTVTITRIKSNWSKTLDFSSAFNKYSQFYISAQSSTTNVYDFYFWFSNSFQWTYDSGRYGYINYSDYTVYKKGFYYTQDSWLNYDWSYTNKKDWSGVFIYTFQTDEQDNLNPYYGNANEPIIANHTIYGHYDTSKVLYAPVVDTTFTYELNGIKRGQVKLTIEDLDSSLNMYGYVGCENTFNVGDTLDTSIISSYLRLLSLYSDNSDLSCTLYEGEKLTYYIVDEDNVILDIGYISELAEGYFLYGFPVNDGVDFVFLNNGQVYWNNDLTFKYQVDSGSLLTKNEIVSTGSYSYIESNKSSAKITYNGFVYDSNGEVISSAVTSTTNNLSSLYMKEVNTNYFENNIGFNKSCYWLQSIILAGTDSIGNDIDFSNYSVRWSIPTWLTVDSIEIGTSTYDKYNGVITGFSSNGVLSIQLKIYELLKNHTNDFDITLEIYNDNGDLVLTYLVNSDDIVKNQILNNENNIDKPSYDITDNPGYTGGSGNKDFSNIQNWTSDDYLNLMSTDNFIWEFFKAILGNLPWWITVPITILIFGVVIITLIRFARGA